MAEITVFVVDPVRETITRKIIAGGSGAISRYVGGSWETDHSITAMFRGHAVAIRKNARHEDKPEGSWCFSSEDGALETIFHGVGVVYGIQAARRTSAVVSEQDLLRSVHFLE